jgi:CBS domain-containing protein
MDVMSLHASTNSIHDTVESVAAKIITGDERKIIIMDENRIEGVITIIDLANILLAEKADLHAMSVRDILTPNMVYVRKQDDATRPAEIMLEWNISGVPVVEERLEGIVRNKDIIQRIRV